MAPSDLVTPGVLADAPGTSLGLANAAVAVVDAGGVVIAWTEGAERLLGYRASEVVNRPADALMARADDDGDDPRSLHWEPSRRAWARRLRAGRHWADVVDVRHRDGRTVRLSVEAAPMHGSNGGTDFLVSAVDITDANSQSTVSAAVMRTLLDHSPVALAIWDGDLRCVWLNTTAEHETGALRHRRLGYPMVEALRGFDTDTIDTVMRQVLRDGVPVIDHEFRWSAADRSEERVFSSSMFRLDSADGVPLGVCTIAVDITNSWARERLALLSKASRRIGTTLDVMTTSRELATVSVPLLADFVAVDLSESIPLGDEPPERLVESDIDVAVFRRAGHASVHPGVPESAFAIGEAIVVPPSSPFYHALYAGEAHFDPVLDMSPGGWADSDPRRGPRIRQTGMHSLMAVPLKARGTILGVAVFARTENSAPFSRDDLLLAEELVGQASLNLDNARRYTRERTAALALQRNLLPSNLSGGDAMDVACRYLPTDTHEGVGGDWFDVISLSGARVALVVGDVVGHGINAAATMGRLRTAVHTLADLDLSPDEVLTHLDNLAVQLSEESPAPDASTMPAMGATCIFAVYDPVTRMCSIARAGHPPPAVVEPNGRVTFPDVPAGAPIGLGLASYESAEIQLDEGSVIALYTDGLVETRDDDIDVGLDRLSEALARPGLELETLCSDVVDTVVPRPSEDDIALLLARSRSLGPDQVASWTLPTDPAGVRTARSLAVEQLTAWDLEQLRPSVELIVSELVTNAVRYGSGPIQLRLIKHKTLVCEVSDSDHGSPRLRHATTTEESGRGLFLVAELTRRWGSRFTADGKTTWAELALPRPTTDGSRSAAK